ncbi:nucleotide disphospho-sugar-binding domain-containing protein [Phytohabitans suffuscus]|uniref:nucleotide disphospho-sugar-binding domain-containing protein n=1 Tax=Phytohabitans suffuscus TaxID=624315 RepID=UPI001564722F|nr:nucleotide disphospho-sugar-binding domain-containing protein [Phytohabitans suffuscus]
MMLGPPAAAAWSMRYVPYNAGGDLPDWLWQPPRRPRVLVTMGTVVPDCRASAACPACSPPPRTSTPTSCSRWAPTPT